MYGTDVTRCRFLIRVVVLTCRAPHHVFNVIIVVIIVKVAIVKDASETRLVVVREWEDATQGTLQTSVIFERPRTNLDRRHGGFGAYIAAGTIKVISLALALLTPLALLCASKHSARK